MQFTEQTLVIALLSSPKTPFIFPVIHLSVSVLLLHTSSIKMAYKPQSNHHFGLYFSVNSVYMIQFNFSQANLSFVNIIPELVFHH